MSITISLLQHGHGYQLYENSLQNSTIQSPRIPLGLWSLSTSSETLMLACTPESNAKRKVRPSFGMEEGSHQWAKRPRKLWKKVWDGTLIREFSKKTLDGCTCKYQQSSLLSLIVLKHVLRMEPRDTIHTFCTNIPAKYPRGRIRCA